MRKLCLAVLMVALVQFAAHATVLTFGPACGSGECTMPANYGGFNWDANFFIEANDAYMGNYGNTYGAPSGAGAFNGFGVMTVQMSNGSPFNFNGVAVTAWAGSDSFQSYSSTTITIDAYDASNNFLGSCGAALSPSSYNFLSCNINGVTTLTFNNDGVDGHWWLMDNFTYNQTTTPEPASLVLLGSGLVGLVGMLRRKRL